MEGRNEETQAVGPARKLNDFNPKMLEAVGIEPCSTLGSSCLPCALVTSVVTGSFGNVGHLAKIALHMRDTKRIRAIMQELPREVRDEIVTYFEQAGRNDLVAQLP